MAITLPPHNSINIIIVNILLCILSDIFLYVCIFKKLYCIFILQFACLPLMVVYNIFCIHKWLHSILLHTYPIISLILYCWTFCPFLLFAAINDTLSSIYITSLCTCFIVEIIKKYFLSCKKFKHGIQRKMCKPPLQSPFHEFTCMYVSIYTSF